MFLSPALDCQNFPTQIMEYFKRKFWAEEEKIQADIYLLGLSNQDIERMEKELRKHFPTKKIYSRKVSSAGEEKLEFMEDGHHVMLLAPRGYDGTVLSQDKGKPSVLGPLYKRVLKKKGIVMIVVTVTSDHERPDESEKTHASMKNSIDCWTQLERDGTEVISTSFRPPRDNPDGDFLTEAQLHAARRWVTIQPVVKQGQSQQYGERRDVDHEKKMYYGQTNSGSRTRGAMGGERYDGITRRNEEPKRVAIICSSSQYLQLVADAVKRATEDILPDLDIHADHMSSFRMTQDMKESVTRARHVLLVAVFNQRLIIISDKEDSQLGDVYYYAKDHGKQPFLILAGDRESDMLDDKESYHHSLDKFVKGQIAVEHMHSMSRFVSLGCDYASNPLDFNSKQKNDLLNWLMRDQK